MPDFNLQVAIADTVKDLLGDTLEHRKSTAAAITPDGRVSPEAVAGALPWQAHDGKIEGAVATGSNQLRWHFPQGGVIRQVSYDARTAPSGGNLEFTISGGTTTETFSLQAGQPRGVSSTNIVMPPGSWARLNVLIANGAADLAVTLQYESAGSGSTSSPGGGGGGGGGTISVISVNGETGVVVLTADHIDDTSTSHKFVSAGDLTTLANTSGVNTGDQDLSGYVLASSLSLVATSGQYDDLSGKPTLFDGDYASLSNKPTIPAQFNPIAGANVTLSGTYPNITFNASGGGGGGGDMFASTYDPNGVADDAFDMDNMVEGSTTKIMTAAERTKLSGIAANAEVNVNADWNATSGDAEILNKPTLGTAAAADTGDFATAVQGGKADTAVQPSDLATVATTGDYDDLSGTPIKPVIDRGIGASTIVASTAGQYWNDNASFTVSGLVPSYTYTVKCDVEIRTSGTSPRSFSQLARGVGVTTVVASGTQAKYHRNDGDATMASNVIYVQPDSNGEIVFTPGIQQLSGTVSVSSTVLTVTLV